jgi:hypothetical protein
MNAPFLGLVEQSGFGDGSGEGLFVCSAAIRRVTFMWKAGMIAIAGLGVWCAAGLAQPEAKADDKATESRATLLPLSFAKGKLEQFKAQLDAKPDYIHTLNKIEYAGDVYWVMDLHLGDGGSYKHVALYAPEKDGSHRQCLFAESCAAGCLEVKFDDKTGVLELREAANSTLKGQLVLACNLKSIGTPHSTRFRK